MTSYMRAYAETIRLLAEHGIEEKFIGHNTVNHFLLKEKKTPVETVRIMLGKPVKVRES